MSTARSAKNAKSPSGSHGETRAGSFALTMGGDAEEKPGGSAEGHGEAAGGLLVSGGCALA
jgi:hypothetical protein